MSLEVIGNETSIIPLLEILKDSEIDQNIAYYIIKCLMKYVYLLIYF